jgi:hypothetical protein
MGKMFERFIHLFNRIKTEATHRLTIHDKNAAFQNEPLKALPAGRDIIEEQASETKPELPIKTSIEPGPTVVSKPAVERKFSMPLPSSISGEEVAMVQHSVNMVSSERFKYVEKPVKAVEKGEQKKPEDIIKYKIKPLNLQAPVEHKDTARSDVIVYGKS